MIPMIFNVDRRDGTGYGMQLTKELGSPHLWLTVVDPYEKREIRLDFRQLLSMLKELVIAEQKEKNRRLHLGIRDG